LAGEFFPLYLLPFPFFLNVFYVAVPMGYLLLLRPVNGFIAALAALTGFWLSGSGLPFPLPVPLWCILLAVFCISGAGNILNDIIDRDIDRVNRPQRSLIQGSARVGQAVWLMSVLFGVGLLAAFLAGWRFFLFALANSCLLVVYSRYLKRRPWWGNLAVAALSSSCFIFGGMFYHRWTVSLIPAAFAFLVHWAREIIKDLEDREGDARAGAATLPLVKGQIFSQRLVQAILGYLLLALPLPLIWKIYNFYYLELSVLTVTIPALWIIVLLRRPRSRPVYGQISRMLKIIMLTGILSVILGSGLI
jgi:geranylgeranylglycerol-phosphate geranylgeranyltransferase